MQFADELAAAEGWDAEALRRELAQAHDLTRIRKLVLPAAAGAAKNWAAYRERFIEPQRVQAGLDFWATHADALARAEASYGVPAEVIVGILGVETFYGRLTGGFRTLDVLATLGFDFPKQHPRAAQRQAFFRSELAEFLRLARSAGLDAQRVNGSFAGALGWPQFMPGSWRRYGVDFDGDGRVDLIGSADDAIGSVAHYLAEQGWQAGQPTHFEIGLPAERAARARLLAPDIKPSFRAAELAELGARLDAAALAHPGMLAVVELQNGPRKPPSYRLGTENFYAITRYNWSAYYAFAVIELGAAVARARPSAAQ
jgi:membrane-bound lytic murein transglycosylase B